MQRGKLEQLIAWLILLVWGLIVLHAPLTVWLVSEGAPIYVKAWKEIVMVVAAILLLIHVMRHKKFTLFTHDPLIWAALAYGLINLVMAVAIPMSLESTLAGLAINLRYVFFFVLVYVFLRLHPSYRKSFITIGLVGVGIVVGFALLQLVLPHDVLKYIGYDKATTIAPYLTVDENPDYIRENSTLRGPNPLGAYAGSVMILTVAFIVNRWRRLANWQHKLMAVSVLIASGVALWVSYSRSALVGTLVGVGLVIAVQLARRMTRKHWVALALGTLVLACIGWAMRDTSFVHNVILHDNPTTGANVDSNAGHLSSLNTGWSRMLTQPFGAGVGSTGSASLLGDSSLIIENQYLMIAHEVGWAGLGIFLWLFYIVMAALWRRRGSWLALGTWAAGVSLALIGLLLPVWADDTVSIVWWGLAALVIAKEVHYGTAADKKAA